ncbi:hypothetical protein CspHIS471_0307360 [Cutaneotrichosporon sp. HIS471]|nr:hypothetical protein CspHIS471_0307360 [Cutaneotrichosporon sp. HIS471]
MLALLKLSVLAALATAQICGPGGGGPSTTTPPPTTTTTPPPNANGVVIHPGSNTNLCVDVAGAKFANGTPVQVYQCNGTPAQAFTLVRGNQQIKVAGTNFCLDAGSNPANGSKLHLWTCYSGVPQQQWYYTNDNRIALTNQGLCLDLTDGRATNGNQLQVWSCGNGNANQVWTSNVSGGSARRRWYHE